ncbi:MAG: Ca-activated chloride channel [Acidobacteriota bacterium]|jgi:VWFA-related protein
MSKGISVAIVVFAAAATLAAQQSRSPDSQSGDNFRFKSGVELVNVTATVSDANGRFVPNLRLEDFTVYEDDQPQTVTQFSAERVPVSLGIVLDTSGSMVGEKIEAARSALDRFLYDLLDDRDEIFLYRFSNDPVLLQEWTSDRRLLSRALGRITPNGGTAMYDAVVEAIPMAASGRNQKKAVLVISDGNDTSSRSGVHEVRQLIRESEVLVYAIGIDGEGDAVLQPRQAPPRQPFPIPFPFPGGPGRRRPGGLQPLPQFGQGWPRSTRSDDRVNVVALRDMTDDSGGRTEIVRGPRDLDPATAGIADELSKQYYLGYQSTGKKDGRWHSIRLDVHNRNYRVRARKGYIAN